MVDVLWTLIGFLIGIVAAGFAVELGLKKFFAPPEASKLTRVWSLKEMGSPLIAATRIDGIQVPTNARLVTAQNFPGQRDGFELRTNPETGANFAVDANQPRALIFLDGVRPGSLAVWSVDERLIERLRSEFHRLWSRSTDYVERVSLAEIPRKSNATVETHGVVQSVVPYRGSYLLRLQDEGDTVGVLVERDLPLAGKRVHVTGIVRTSSSGYPLIEAVEVKAAAA